MAYPSRPAATAAAAAIGRQLRRAGSTIPGATPRPTLPTLRTTPIAPTSTSRASSSSSSSSTFSSVNADEVSHFNALADSWWDPHGPSRLLHLMNPLRHDFIHTCRTSAPSSPSSPSRSASASTPDQPGLRYLDVGCGGGIFAESAARLPTTSSVTAIDPTPSVLSVARAHAKRDPSLLRAGRLSYLPATIETLPQPATAQDRFDVVSVFEVVEHVERPDEFLRRCAPFVAPGGWLVGSTIARTFVSWLTTNLVAEDLLGIVPKGTHDWNKYINEWELRGWFASQAGNGGPGTVQWTNPKIMGVVYVPGCGWKEVSGGEKVGNYFFGFQRRAEGEA